MAILGAGTWGSTLSWLLASQGKRVTLWSRDSQKAKLLASRRRVNHPLRIELPTSLEITSDLPAALSSAQIVLLCCNSQSMRELVGKVQLFTGSSGNSDVEKTPILVNCAKGLELTTLYRMSEVIAEVAPGYSYCCLSGPNLAAEILKGLPTASVIASKEPEIASFVQSALNVSSLRMYTNTDVVGVELGGTLKNVIAIAAGVSDGLELGANAKAALITRGLAEMTRLACAIGAERSTLSGLAGMGDLLATCGSSLSRNYSLGQSLAAGLSREEAKRAVGATAEGIPTCQAVCELSKKLGIAMPIAEQVEATLTGKTTPKGAIMSLMSRPLVSEQETTIT